MKKFLSIMWMVFWIIVIIPSPVLSVAFLVSFLLTISGWFGFLAVLFIPAFALSVLIFDKALNMDIFDVFDL